jgi:ribosomal protein S14
VWRDTRGEQRLQLRPGEWVIGRGEDCDVVVRDFGLSRRHARLVVSGDEVRVVDLKSKGGTQVDGQPVLEGTLGIGSRLRLGTVECRLEAAAAASPGRHELRCATCGAPAATLEIGPDPFRPERQALVYSGLVRRQAFALSLAEAALGALAAGRVGAAHRLLGGEGIDAYCPDCGVVYCGEHYRLDTRYDDDFYDCAYATCPAGHRRMIDD